MRTLKKTLCLVLCLAMMAGLCVFASADFNDQDKIENEEAVAVLTGIGVINGDDKGNFNPEGTLTRAEATVIITKILGAADIVTTTTKFSDVKADYWGMPYIAYCTAEGIVAGMGDGTFAPNAKLTGYQWATLLLRTIGYKVEGETWQIDVAKLVKSLDLADGITFNGTEEISRQDAAQMAFNALFAQTVHYEGGSKVTVGGVEIVTGETLVKEYYKDGNDEKIETLAHTHFETLAGGAKKADDFGRPVSIEWTYKAEGAKKATTIYKEGKAPVATYVEGFNTSELNKLKKDYTFKNTEILVNGAKDTSVTVEGLASREYTGTGIELYSTGTDKDNIDLIVVEQVYLAKVTQLRSGYKTASLNSISLDVYNPWHTNKVVPVTFADDTSDTPSVYDELSAEYKKDEFVLVYFKGADVAADHFISAEPVVAEKVTVNSTKYDATNGFNGYFVGGTTKYVFASAYAEDTSAGGALTLSKEYTLYFDANGYVIGAVLAGDTSTDTVVNYAVYLDGERIPGSVLRGTTATERAQLYTSEGKVVVLDTAVELNSDGYTAKEWVLPTSNNDIGLSNGDLIAYTLTEDGELASVTKATATAGLTTQAKKGNAFKVVSGEATYASAKTVIFVCKTGTLTGKSDIAVYTGYAAVPAATYTAGKALQADTKNAGALTVTIDNLPGAEDTQTQYIVLTDAAPVISAGTDGFKYKYTWNAIVDGKETEVYALSNTTVTYDANKLATVTFNSKTGAISTFVPVTLNNAQITAVTEGFYEVGSATKYTSDKTVYYKVICENAQTLTQGNIEGYEAVEGFDALGETVEVYQTLVVGGDSVDSTVKVVFFYTYLK